MMWQSALATSLLLLGQVSAGVLDDAGLLVRREDSMEQGMKRYVNAMSEQLGRRQSGIPVMNITQWNSMTMTACTAALSALKGNASNPSGTAACYNLPFLDNSTGVFQADLRIFTISPPTGAFANIPSNDVTVALSYVGASIAPVNTSTLRRREEDRESLISWPRSLDGVKRRQAASAPTLVQAYSFVGQVNKDLLSSTMDTATLQSLLVPTVTLSAVDSSGATVNTSLSSNEATFVSGVFAAVAVSKSVVQPPIQTLVVASDAPFVVPGLHILIFPIGGIITGIWAILFIATVGYGTIGRVQFKDQYRRRSQRADKAGLATI